MKIDSRNELTLVVTMVSVLVLAIEAAKKQDYYDLLSVSRTATDREIKRSFRKLALKYHPDKNKEKGAEEKFRQIAEAYSVLSDPEKKKQYDMYGHSAFGADQGSDHANGFQSQGFPFPDMSDFFRHFDDAFHFHSGQGSHHEQYHEPGRQQQQFNHHFQNQHRQQQQHYHEHRQYHHQSHGNAHVFHGFDFDDLFRDMDSPDTGSFFGAPDPFAFSADQFDAFGTGSSFFGSHFPSESSFSHSESSSNGCKVVTKRVGNTVSTYTHCS